MKEKSIFSKIIAKDIPANIIFEDEFSILIEDISPQAPIHYLAIPKKEIIGISDMSTDDKELIGHLMLMIKEQMTKIGIKDYRLVINNGSEAGQTVFHLHIHVLANRTLAWPPG
tara:strand:+ start:765 stop:1106 length:342 start_codon:yes stop_codon:yes gene_type:complete